MGLLKMAKYSDKIRKENSFSAIQKLNLKILDCIDHRLFSLRLVDSVDGRWDIWDEIYPPSLLSHNKFGAKIYKQMKTLYSKEAAAPSGNIKSNKRTANPQKTPSTNIAETTNTTTQQKGGKDLSNLRCYDCLRYCHFAKSGQCLPADLSRRQQSLKQLAGVSAPPSSLLNNA